MRILGIETSCDETGVCLIEAEGSGPGDLPTGQAGFQFKVLGNALYSQVAIHAPYGGVFPNLAKREHAKNLVPLLKQVLDEVRQSFFRASACRSGREKNFTAPIHEGEQISEVLSREPELLEQLQEFLQAYEKPDIDAIAVTHGPGLEPALWVGVNFARALSLAWGVPLIATNHMEGHIVLSMTKVNGIAHFSLPILSLLISGGHTELVLSREWLQYELVGHTRDDAAGEAFDKVARLLNLPYPGGPEISRLAAEARSQSITPSFTLPRPMIHEDNLDFSFSGLKTAVRRMVEERGTLSEVERLEFAREFEDAATDVLVHKTLKAAKEYGARTIVVGGGVSANTYIRARLAEAIETEGIEAELLIPPAALATDNALMIALAGYFHAIRNEYADPSALRANGNLKLA